MDYEMWRDSFDSQNTTLREDRLNKMADDYERDAYCLRQVREEYKVLATVLENIGYFDPRIKEQITKLLGEQEEIIMELESHVEDLRNELEEEGIPMGNWQNIGSIVSCLA